MVKRVKRVKAKKVRQPRQPRQRKEAVPKKPPVTNVSVIFTGGNNQPPGSYYFPDANQVVQPLASNVFTPTQPTPAQPRPIPVYRPPEEPSLQPFDIIPETEPKKSKKKAPKIYNTTNILYQFPNSNQSTQPLPNNIFTPSQTTPITSRPINLTNDFTPSPRPITSRPISLTNDFTPSPRPIAPRPISLTNDFTPSSRLTPSRPINLTNDFTPSPRPIASRPINLTNDFIPENDSTALTVYRPPKSTATNSTALTVYKPKPTRTITDFIPPPSNNIEIINDEYRTLNLAPLGKKAPSKQVSDKVMDSFFETPLMNSFVETPLMNSFVETPGSSRRARGRPKSDFSISNKKLPELQDVAVLLGVNYQGLNKKQLTKEIKFAKHKMGY